MLFERLSARVRVTTIIGAGSVGGRRLAFHKWGADGSGKCNIPLTNNPTDCVHGVLFDLPEDQLPELDLFEGAGCGYLRSVLTVEHRGSPTEAAVYLAQGEHTDEGLVPYDWYHELVIAGARQNALPEGYIAELAAVPTRVDPDPGRLSRVEALEVLKAHREAMSRSRD